MTKNKLTDLNDHLFAQLERLSDEGLSGDKLDQEIKRGEAVAKVADQIVRNASVQLQAAKLVSDHGFDPTPHLPEVLGKPAAAKQLTGRSQ
ncbi:hypothetical protein ACVWXN_003427 [Bradyrhizobium sp. i1.4.4]